MHLLYLDDAGSAANVDEQYLVLGGISVYEAQANWFVQELDKLASTIDAANPHAVEFHASEIYARRTTPWNSMRREEAQGVIKAVLDVVKRSYGSAKVFACAIHKASYPSTDVMQLAFEDLCSRFDRYLSQLHEQGDRQRGILILDESAHETTLQKMARDFRTFGTQWGYIRNLAETPLFVPSKASRLVQVADAIAYAVFRRYNASDTNYFDVIAHKFYSHQNVVHGLAHKQKVNSQCMCIACLSRRMAHDRTEDQLTLGQTEESTEP
ncbi:MAG TPA: DUF3800 domain-containing protein [Bacteroidota bacterium]|nr:DUF3800 domain-containing protein [Bacteroidota bacterium]